VWSYFTPGRFIQNRKLFISHPNVGYQVLLFDDTWHEQEAETEALCCMTFYIILYHFKDLSGQSDSKDMKLTKLVQNIEQRHNSTFLISVYLVYFDKGPLFRRKFN